MIFPSFLTSQNCKSYRCNIQIFGGYIYYNNTVPLKSQEYIVCNLVQKNCRNTPTGYGS